jgi:hypothetical protein
MGEGRQGERRGARSRERAALGVGVEFGECMHTWEMVEIRVVCRIPGKAYRSITINDVRTNNHKYKNNVMFYNAFIYLQALTPPHVPC